MAEPKPQPALNGPPAARSGRPELDHIFRAHGGWLLDFLRRRFGRQAAEELAQETYLRLAASSTTIRNPKAFLATTAMNAARDQARRGAARPQLAPEESHRLATEPSQAELLLLKQVVSGLPHNLRAVFYLSRFAGLTYEEIAEHCGVSVKTVEARMSKALRICTARLRA